MFRHLFPNLIWRIPTDEKILYLTFDDGPIPEVTPWVLGQLEKWEARATFFCVGDNVRKHPEVFEAVRRAGHTLGNHTFNHLNGWDTGAGSYLQNVERCRDNVPSSLFRPPHGKLGPAQTQGLLRDEYQIVMWDVLSADFDRRLTGRQVLRNVTRHAGPGSVVVFHDSLKAWDRLQYALPRTLSHFAARGYRFAGLKEAGVLAQAVA